PDSFFRSLEAISRELRVPFSRRLLLQRFPPPYDLAAVQRAARALGARAELGRLRRREMRPDAGCYALMRLPRESSADAGGESATDPTDMLRLMRVERIERDVVVL